jgi:hypothetical protein
MTPSYFSILFVSCPLPPEISEITPSSLTATTPFLMGGEETGKI